MNTIREDKISVRTLVPFNKNPHESSLSWKRGTFCIYIEMQEQRRGWTSEITRSRELNPIKISFYLCYSLCLSFILLTARGCPHFFNQYSEKQCANSFGTLHLLAWVPEERRLIFSWSWDKSPAREMLAYVVTLSCPQSITRPLLPLQQKWKAVSKMKEIFSL